MSHAHSDAHAQKDDGRVHAHIAPTKFYIGVFGALIALTLITVGASYVDLGSANTVVAVLIATLKASLVAAFFMHLTHDRLFNTVALVSAFVFLAIFVGFTSDDLSKRGRIDDANGTTVHATNGQVAPGGLPSSAPAPAPSAAPAHH